MSLVITTYSSPPPPHLSKPLSIYFYSPPLFYHPPTNIMYHLSLAVTPDPHLLYRRYMSFTWTSPTPTTRKSPPLVSETRAACLIILPCTMSVHSPFYALGLLPCTCFPLGARPSPPSPPVSLVYPPLPTCVILRLL